MLPLIFCFSLFTVVNESHAAEWIDGNSRYTTAIKISNKEWDKADTVIIAKGDDFPDALAGGPLAYSLDAPILLTKSDSLNSQTKEEIKRLNAKKVIILGGPEAVSDKVEKELNGIVKEVDRIYGTDRFETAAKIAERLPSSKAIVVYGWNFVDALAVSPYAAKNQIPILLTDTNKLNPYTTSALEDKKETIVIGGHSVISNKVKESLPNAKRVDGKHRFETARNIVNILPMGVEKATIVNGYNFPDALTSSVYSAKNNQPVLLVAIDSIPYDTAEIMSTYKSFDIVGGPDAINEKVFSKVAQAEKRKSNITYIPYSNVENGEVGITKLNLISGHQTTLLKLKTGGEISNVRESNDGVYFLRNGSIFKINKDGSGLKTILDADKYKSSVDEFEVDQENIYIIFDPHSHSDKKYNALFKMKKSDLNLLPISNKDGNRTITNIAIDKDFIYYYSFDGLFKVKKDGSSELLLIKDSDDIRFNCDCLFSVGEKWIAASVGNNRDEYGHTMLVSKDGKVIKHLPPNEDYGEFVTDHWVYYYKQIDKGKGLRDLKIYRYNIESPNKHLLVKTITMPDEFPVILEYIDDHTLVFGSYEYKNKKTLSDPIRVLIQVDLN